jgi:monoamine oxidase
MFDVAIIGCGLAGLAAAVESKRLGMDVVVLEASCRPGGRVRTVVDDQSQSLIELGGEAIGINHHTLKSICESHSIPLIDAGPPEQLIPDRVLLDGLELSQSTVASLRHELLALIDHLTEVASRVPFDSPWGKMPQAVFRLGELSVESWMLANGYSSDLVRVFTDLPENGQSVLALLTLMAGVGAKSFFFDNERLSIEGGTTRLVGTLFEEVREAVVTETIVQRIITERDNVQIGAISLDGRQMDLRARSAIVALPANAVRNVHGLDLQSRNVTASVSSNQRMTIIGVAGSRPASCKNKMIVTDEICRLIAASTVYTPSGSFDRIDVLLRSNARRLLDISQLSSRALEVADIQFPGQYATLTHGWGSDPLSLGSYAFYGVGAITPKCDSTAGGSGPVFFAGDYVIPSLAGYMEGAVRSGMAASRGALARVS